MEKYMDTVIYLIRHGKTDKTKLVDGSGELTGHKEVDLDDSFIPKIEEFSEKMNFKDIKNVYSSKYVRARKTAEILSGKSDINIDDRLGERLGGIPNLDITPEEYYKMQFDNPDFCFPEGETVNQIIKRMDEAINDIIEKNRGEESIVVSHGAAITFYLRKWCNIEITNVEKKIRRFEYNGNVIHEGVVNFIQCFKLIFNDNNQVINIEVY